MVSSMGFEFVNIWMTISYRTNNKFCFQTSLQHAFAEILRPSSYRTWKPIYMQICVQILWCNLRAELYERSHLLQVSHYLRGVWTGLRGVVPLAAAWRGRTVTGPTSAASFRPGLGPQTAGSCILVPPATSTLNQRKGRVNQPSITFSCQAGGVSLGGGGPVVEGWWWGGGVLQDDTCTAKKHNTEVNTAVCTFQLPVETFTNKGAYQHQGCAVRTVCMQVRSGRGDPK